MTHLQQGRLHHTKVLKRLPDTHIYTCILVQLYTHMHSRSVLLCFDKYQNTQAFYTCALWKYQNKFCLLFYAVIIIVMITCDSTCKNFVIPFLNIVYSAFCCVYACNIFNCSFRGIFNNALSRNNNHCSDKNKC